VAARQSPLQEHARQQEIVEEKETGRVQVPISDIVRGIADRATGNRLAQESKPQMPLPKAALTIPEELRFIRVDLSRFEPFRDVSASLDKLDQLERSHFDPAPAPPGVQRTGGAPTYLHPIRLCLGLSAWDSLSVSVRKYLAEKFLDRARAEVGESVRELDRLLKARVSEIERFAPIQDGPEAGGSFRA
jgi:hypothetical protein